MPGWGASCRVLASAGASVGGEPPGVLPPHAACSEARRISSDTFASTPRCTARGAAWVSSMLICRLSQSDGGVGHSLRLPARAHLLFQRALELLRHLLQLLDGGLERAQCLADVLGNLRKQQPRQAFSPKPGQRERACVATLDCSGRHTSASPLGPKTSRLTNAMTKASGAPTPRKEARTTDLRSCFCHVSVPSSHARPSKVRRRTVVAGRCRFEGALCNSGQPAWASPLRQPSFALTTALRSLPVRASRPTDASRQTARPACTSAAAVGMQPLAGERHHILQDPARCTVEISAYRPALSSDLARDWRRGLTLTLQ